MREKMTHAQVEFLNRVFSSTVRKLSKIKAKMDASKLPQDDAVFAAVTAAIQSLYVVCEVTHERLEVDRPPPPDLYKPTGMAKTRAGLEATARWQTAMIERGRADAPAPTKPKVDDDGSPY